MYLFPRISASKFLAALCLLLLLLLIGSSAAWAEWEEDELDLDLQLVWDLTSDQEPQLNAAAAALIDGRSGRVLWHLNGDQPLPPASTGKVITALTALDLADLTESYTISTRAAAVGESSIHLRAGETLTLEDLIKGALVHSGNDACFAIAEGVAGSESLFVAWLNLKAQLLGAYSADLKNTNGLPAEGHQISAIDLAQLTRYALQDETFATVVSSKQTELGEGGSYRTYKNTNKLLWHDDDITGVKTGTTDAAGPCLITSMQVGDGLLISVVFNSPDRYGESLRVLRYGLANYTLTPLLDVDELAAYLPVTDGVAAGVLVKAEGQSWCAYNQAEVDELYLRWRLPATVAAPVEAGEHLGSLLIYNGEDELLSSVSLVAAESVDQEIQLSFWQRLKLRFSRAEAAEN